MFFGADLKEQNTNEDNKFAISLIVQFHIFTLT